MTTEQLIAWLEERLERAADARRSAPVGSVAWTEASESVRRLEADLIELRRLLVEASDAPPAPNPPPAPKLAGGSVRPSGSTARG